MLTQWQNRHRCTEILAKIPDSRNDDDLKTLHVLLDSVGFFKRLPGNLHLRVSRLLSYRHFNPGEVRQPITRKSPSFCWAIPALLKDFASVHGHKLLWRLTRLSLFLSLFIRS